MVEKGLKSRKHSPKLTITEIVVVDMILKQFKTPREIANSRQVSVQSVYKILKRVREKGININQDIKGLKKTTHVTKTINNEWRYHNIHFLVKPFYFYPRYFKFKDSGNVFVYGDWRFKLHRDCVEVQSKALVEFCNKDKYEAIRLAELSFNKCLLQASNRYGFLVFKEGKASIKLVAHHLAFGESDVAKGSKESYLRIRCERGKTWFLIDRSKGFLEHEYVDEVVPDSEELEPFFNDIRSGAWGDLKSIVRYITVDYAENLKNHQKAIDGIREGQKIQNSILKKLDRGIRKLSKNLKGDGNG